MYSYHRVYVQKELAMKESEVATAPPQAHETPAKKNFRLYQSKIDRAKQALGADTETDTINQALDFVIFRDELVKGVRAMKGAELVDIFADEG
jgi:hypothetical protein